MSIRVLSWVFQQPIRPSSVKFVLVAIADCADDRGRAFPSVEHICCTTSQDRKTVISAVQQLAKLGLVSDTGQRVGSTRSVKVLRINLDWEPEAVPETEPDSSTENGTGKQYRFSAEAVPFFRGSSTENGTRNRKEPSLTVSKPKSQPLAASPALPAFVPADAWDAYIEHRKAKRSKPTKRALELLFRTLEEINASGGDVRASIEQSIQNGWTGIFPVRAQPRQEGRRSSTAAAIFGNATESTQDITGESKRVA